MSIAVIAESIIILFLLMGVGYLCRRTGVIGPDGARGLSSFVVNVSLPALILMAMQVPLTAELVANAGGILFGIAVFYGVSFAIAFTIPRFIAESDLEQGVMRFMLVFSNLGFMGIPVAGAVFGPEAIFYVSIFNLTFSILLFSVGVLMLRPDMGRYLDPKLFLNTGLIASVAGLVLFALQVHIPSPFADVFTLLGTTTTPLAMVVVGALLATMPIEGIFTDKKIWVITILRLCVIPLAVFLILRPFVEGPFLLGIPVLLAAMPVAANAVMLAEEYHVDATIASKGVFLTTILSLITLPLITLLIT
ncbi:AEC family transporter [Methanogenium marinum]|uniref:AEC family transporter n=1 Tax=Methanogenium marinum TaxID=348610 RepID=A0A9Q4PYQ3_9EURY|nr:AEC family transporter [Methanogenium marinum]MDE4908397.1 AEC family transporter [Methanogenium marinum]